MFGQLLSYSGGNETKHVSQKLSSRTQLTFKLDDLFALTSVFELVSPSAGRKSNHTECGCDNDAIFYDYLIYLII